jgi:hypothetical protein
MFLQTNRRITSAELMSGLTRFAIGLDVEAIRKH